MLHLDLSVGVLVNRERVDHTDRLLVMQSLKLSDDLAMEIGVVETNDDQLNGSDSHQQPPFCGAFMLARQDPGTPAALVEMLAGLEARAQAALDSARNIARGIYPPLLADFGLAEALRSQAVRAAVDVRLMGTTPRGTEAAEEAVYFACSEAIQNAAKYAGRGTQVTLRLRHDQGSLGVRVADDGQGFDPAHTPEGAGVQNIRDRIEDLGGTFEVASSPGHGTVLTISLPWPAAADGRR